MPLGAGRFTVIGGGAKSFDVEYLVVAGAGGGGGGRFHNGIGYMGSGGGGAGGMLAATLSDGMKTGETYTITIGGGGAGGAGSGSAGAKGTVGNNSSFQYTDGNTITGTAGGFTLAPFQAQFL